MMDHGARAIIGKEIMPELQRLAEAARQSISIFFYSATLPNARAPLAMTRAHAAMKQAPGRGISCRAILATWPETSPQAAESRRFASDLTYSGWACRWAPQAPIMHPKTWIFDETAVIVGSHNSTVAGLSMNRNISIMTTSPNAIMQIAEYFTQEWEKAVKHG